MFGEPHFEEGTIGSSSDQGRDKVTARHARSEIVEWYWRHVISFHQL
jgi:hypothetical protein